MSWWVLEAVWTEPTAPGLYARDGGTLATYGETRTFAENRDAELHRAALLQAHPDATVIIRPQYGDRGRGPAHPADPRRPLADARQALDRSRR